MCVIVTERKKSACTFYGSKQSQINVFSVKAVVVKVADSLASSHFAQRGWLLGCTECLGHC